MTLVSTVMPARNAAGTIRHALTSALHQTVEATEIIVCDDASSDDTVSTCLGIQDERLKLIANITNLGPGPSRDRAIYQATSAWIALMDADDVWHTNRLSRLLAAAESTGADVIFDDTLLCHDVDGKLIPWRRLHGTRAFGCKGASAQMVRIEDYIVSDRLLIHPLIRKDLIHTHGVRHSSRRFAEDAEFYLRLALAGAKFCYVPEPLYYYRITPGSLTAQAKDPSLMRQCLEACAQWKGWSPSVQSAFQTKIDSLHVNEAMYDLAGAVRGRRFGRAARLLAAEPRLLARLPRSLFRQLVYQVHRFTHGGSGR